MDELSRGSTMMLHISASDCWTACSDELRVLQATVTAWSTIQTPKSTVHKNCTTHTSMGLAKYRNPQSPLYTTR